MNNDFEKTEPEWIEFSKRLKNIRDNMTNEEYFQFITEMAMSELEQDITVDTEIINEAKETKKRR